MLSLPLLNVRLRACSEDWGQMTPDAQGHHCAACQRLVLDFTQATQADLESAFRTAPDGRVCGQFKPAQLAPDQPAPLPTRPVLRPKLRRFLVTLLLVCGLGLGAQEAAAQALFYCKPAQTKPFESIADITADALGLKLSVHPSPAPSLPFVGMVVEPMPEFEGGQEGLQAFLQKSLHYPDGATSTGKIFVAFIVAADGQVKDAKIVRGLEPSLDREVLRVINRMPAWKPGTQRGKVVDIHYTLPVTFNAK